MGRPKKSLEPEDEEFDEDLESDAQAIEGYGCKCGYKTDNKDSFTRHLMDAGRLDGKGVHSSIGRVNLVTGEVVMAPWLERTSAERKLTANAIHKDGVKLQDKANSTQTRITDNLGEASEIRFVPRIYTATLSPILITAITAAQRAWGWRKDMPIINFIDTCIYTFFKEHGITLAAYIVETPPDEEGDAQGPPITYGALDSPELEVKTEYSGNGHIKDEEGEEDGGRRDSSAPENI